MKEEMSISKLIVFLLFYVLIAIPIFQITWYQPPSIIMPSTQTLGGLLFSLQGFVVPFEIMSLVLLAAMIGAVYLAKEARK